MAQPDKIVEVPGVGNVAFPGGMSDDAIAEAIKGHLAKQDKVINSMLAKNPPLPPYYGFTPSNILENVWQGIKGLTGGTYALGKDLVQNPNWIEGPQSTFHKFVVAPSQEQTIQAGQALNQGQKIPAVGHALASAIPFIGPWAAGLGEQAGRGDIGGAVGQIGGTALAGTAADLSGKAISQLPETIDRAKLLGRTPESAVIRALNQGKISKTELKPKSVAQVLPDIKRIAPDIRGLHPDIEGNTNFLNALKQTKADLWNQYLQRIGRYANDTIDGDKYIADPMIQAIPEDIKFEAARGDAQAQATIDAVKQKANLYRGPITLKDLETLRLEKTAEQGGFFRKGTRQQYEAQTTQVPTAVLNAQAIGFRNAVNDILQRHDNEHIAGKLLRSKYGTLRSMQTAAEKQQPNLAAKTPIDIWRGLGALSGAGEAAGALFSGHPFGALAAAGPVLTGEILRRLNNPDYMLRTAMQQIQPNTVIPFVPRQPIGLLPPGPLIVPYHDEPAGSAPTSPATRDYSTAPQPPIEPSQVYSEKPRSLEENEKSQKLKKTKKRD